MKEIKLPSIILFCVQCQKNIDISKKHNVKHTLINLDKTGHGTPNNFKK